MSQHLSSPESTDHINGKAAIIYKFIRPVGSGTYGQVWLVEKDGRQYAIKMLMEVNKGFPDPIELDVMMRFNHPNINRALEVIDMKQHDGDYGLVMNLSHFNLVHFMSFNQNLNLQTKIDLLFQLASGLSFLHQHRILHLDLKPENILMDIESEGRYQLKITDFGLSRYATKSQRSVFPGLIKMDPSRLITKIYRPPEILIGSRTYTSKSDVWSLGHIFLYVLSNGQTSLLYTSVETVKQIDVLFDDIVRRSTIERVLQNISKDQLKPIVDLIYQMLAIDPIFRYEMNDVVNHPVFHKRAIIPGHIKTVISQKLTRVYSFHYAGLVHIISISMTKHVSVETLFLACDIYHRLIVKVPYLNLDRNQSN